MVTRTIANAQTAVPITYGRSEGSSTARLGACRTATARAIAAAAPAATNAGHRGPAGPSAVSRMGFTAPAAPYAAYTTPIAVARGMPR